VLPIIVSSSEQQKGTPAGDGYLVWNVPGPVGPKPVNPADYGLCGVYSLKGEFTNPKTVAKIIVEPSGYYGVYVKALATNPHPPVIAMTCVYLRDFTHLPPISDAVGSSHSLTGTGTPASSTGNIGGPADACIWAGVQGAISEAPEYTATGGPVGPPFVGANLGGVPPILAGQTQLQAYTDPGFPMTTSAFCTGYTKPGFAWIYYPMGGGECEDNVFQPLQTCTIPATSAGVSTNEYWCYITGASGPSAFNDKAAVSNFEVALSLSNPTPSEHFYEGFASNNAIGEGVTWNCLKFDQ
jgi:hypothetical protein